MAAKTATMPKAAMESNKRRDLIILKVNKTFTGSQQNYLNPGKEAFVKQKKFRTSAWDYYYNGDDIFRKYAEIVEIDGYQYKRFKKTDTFKPYNYLKAPENYLSLPPVQPSQEKDDKYKCPDEQFAEALSKVKNIDEIRVPLPPQAIQPDFVKAPFVRSQDYNELRQRKATSYRKEFPPPGKEYGPAKTFKPFYLIRDAEDEISFDFAKDFKHVSFLDTYYPREKCDLVTLPGSPPERIKALQSEYEIRFQNFFPLKIPPTKHIPENTPQFLQYLS